MSLSLLLTWLIASPLIALVIAKTLGRLLDPRQEELSIEALDLTDEEAAEALEGSA